jgi:NADH:ubiquinone oxidoreductase subunit C
MTGEEIVGSIQKKFGSRARDLVLKTPKRIFFTIDAVEIRQVAAFLFDDLKMRFNIASAVDEFDAFEIIYHFSKDEDGILVNARVFLKDKKNPRIDSILPIMRGAEWIEREIHELFGVEFDGHPNMRPLLLPDDWPQGVYPLRRDFVPPKRDDRGEN